MRRRELEHDDPVAEAREIGHRIAGTGADRELDPLQNLVRLPPAAEACGLVGPDDEERVVAESSLPYCIDSERMRIETDAHPRKCSLGQPKSRLWIGDDARDARAAR